MHPSLCTNISLTALIFRSHSSLKNRLMVELSHELGSLTAYSASFYAKYATFPQLIHNLFHSRWNTTPK